MSIVKKETQIVRAQKLIAGLRKHFKSGSLTLATKKLSIREIESVLQARIDAIEAASAARVAWQALLEEERSRTAESKKLVDNLVQLLLTTFDGSPTTLADFGLATRKRHEPKVATKAAAAAKAVATRSGAKPQQPSPADAAPAPAAVPAAVPTTTPAPGAP